MGQRLQKHLWKQNKRHKIQDVIKQSRIRCKRASQKAMTVPKKKKKDSATK